jgi:hypothetical protein
MKSWSRSGMRSTAVWVAVGWLAAGCASTAAQPGGGPSSAGAGLIRVSGRVLGEPGCPGPARLESPCPPRAMPGSTVEADRDGRMVAQVSAATDGYFQLRLLPGAYRITATAPGPLKSTIGKDIVVSGAPVSVDLTVDTGMR